jgi:hypothetical protein
MKQIQISSLDPFMFRNLAGQYLNLNVKDGTIQITYLSDSFACIVFRADDKLDKLWRKTFNQLPTQAEAQFNIGVSVALEWAKKLTTVSNRRFDVLTLPYFTGTGERFISVERTGDLIYLRVVREFPIYFGIYKVRLKLTDTELTCFIKALRGEYIKEMSHNYHSLIQS